MKTLFVTSEAAPFIKTGGLGDVSYALPKALIKKGVEVCVVMPLYKSIKETYIDSLEFVCEFTVPLSWRMVYCGVFSYTNENVKYYFIDNEYYFKRSNVYGDFDDGERYAFFSKAVLEMMLQLDYYPDVLHMNDWQTALVPVFLKAHYSHLDKFKAIKTLFTIHNIEYQGKMPYKVFTDILGLEDWCMQYLNFGNCINFMFGAITLSDKVTTVSKTYAEEIKNSFFGKGLENVLQQHSYKLSGIVNGIDTQDFNPQTDNAIARKYSAKSIHGKAINKLVLQSELGLPQNVDVPVVSMITRLVAHKGIDLVKRVFNEIINRDIQFVILGTGEPEYEDFFREMQRLYPDKVKAKIMFDSKLANKIYAGSDMFLMPSASEPCGLAQMIAMRYGAIPIVRETGGLKDTVSPYNNQNGEGRGFTFKSYNAHDMLDAINRTMYEYYNKESWKALVINDMNEDFSWDCSADEYIDLYNCI